MAKIFDRIEKRQEEQQNMLDLHDLILNGKPLQEMPGLVQKHKEIRTIVDGHEEYLKKKKIMDKLLMTIGGVAGGAIVTILVKLIENWIK